jgi:Ras-related protein Rab-21
MLGNDVVLCIVGNKIDLEKDRHVSIQTAEDYAKSVNAKLYHTSAKLNKGVEELFNDLAQRKLVDRKKIIKIFYSCFLRYA